MIVIRTIFTSIRQRLGIAAMLLCAIFCAGPVCAYGAEPSHEVADARILSFETPAECAAVMADEASDIGCSGLHYKHLGHSLRWQWHRDGAALRIDTPVDYLPVNPDPTQTSIPTFIFWIYSERPLGGHLQFAFGRGDETCCSFDFGLSFSGWRSVWVAFDRDMQGTPQIGMDRLTVSAEGVDEGTVYLDHIIACSFQDSRHHTADTQAPYINRATNSHWLRLLEWWNDPLEPAAGVDEGDRADLARVETRLAQLLLEGRKAQPADKLRERFDSYGIRRNADSTICGKSIFFVRHAEAYAALGYDDAAAGYAADGRLLSRCCDLLFDLAVAYNAAAAGEREQLEAMYLDLTRHLLDQGFSAGSAAGTLHHLGYSMRNFYTAHFVMREVLRRAGMLQSVQQAMEWFSGLGEVKRLPELPGMDIDAFNTSLTGRLAALMLIDDQALKTAFMHRFSEWVDNGLQLTEGTSPCLKSDGTVYHHRRHYPAYAVGGFTGAVNAVWLLAGTRFAVSENGYGNLKRALLEMRFYCNLRSFPLALSGRHPDGKGALIPNHYARLAMAGSDDGQPADRELAAAYMRLATNPNDRTCRAFAAAGIVAEPDPEGCRTYPYNGSLSMRRGRWLVTAAGHSRYLWSAEIYHGCNLYGRYLTHGSLQVLGSGEPVSAFGSGFRQEGWDWCHIPGTTAAVIPMERMQATILNVDTFSGYEEMLLSDESFCGGATLSGRHGAFGMILHEHDKYNGTLRARKSYFFFDNRIVALGSAIENALPGSRTHTTLFQCAIAPQHESFEAGGRTFTGTGHSLSLHRQAVLRDNYGTLYYIPRGRVLVKSSRQHSLHEETAEPTEGDFVMACIDHGGKVKDAGYEYLMVVDADPGMRIDPGNLPYEVNRCDGSAHIVTDRQTGVRAMMLFEAGATDDSLVTEVSQPAAVLYGPGESSDGSISLSVADPDLRLYEGPSDEVFTPDGKRVERSIYSRTWIDNPSAPSTITLTLHGQWRPAGGDVCTTSLRDGYTIVNIPCREGATRQIELQPIRP